MEELNPSIYQSETEPTTPPNQEYLPSQHNTYTIISTVAYLIGVPKRIFENDHEPPKLDIYNQLEKNKNARIIRNLCLLRNAIERNFKTIHDKFVHEYKSLMSVPEQIPPEILKQLSDDGVSIFKSNYKLTQYVIDINRLISDRINNGRELFPIWINWIYVRNIFLMPNGLNEAGCKQAAEVYYANKNFYPYQCYLNWTPSNQGNIFYNDKKFVTLLYEWNHDEFTDLSKVSDVDNRTKNSIYGFLADSEKTVVVVDCENSDPYNLYATLNNLNSTTLSKITKIVLYNDVHASSAWDILNDFTTIPIEHVLIERIKENKSLVDIRLTAGACREFYQNQVDSFVIVSSDSDYWGLISSLPEARFLVMMEHEKCGPDIKAALTERGIFYCYIDDFYSGNSNEIKLAALTREIYRYLRQTIHLNVNDMMDAAFQASRVVMSPAEKKQFYNKFIRPMHLVICEDGNVNIELQSR